MDFIAASFALTAGLWTASLVCALNQLLDIAQFIDPSLRALDGAIRSAVVRFRTPPRAIDLTSRAGFVLPASGRVRRACAPALGRSAWSRSWKAAVERLSLARPPEGTIERPLLTNPETRGVTPDDRDMSTPVIRQENRQGLQWVGSCRPLGFLERPVTVRSQTFAEPHSTGPSWPVVADRRRPLTCLKIAANHRETGLNPRLH